MNWTRWTQSLMVAAAVGLAAACGGDAGDDAELDDTDVVETGAGTQTAPATTGAAPGNLPPGVTAEMVTQGQQVFAGNPGTCFTCHGQDARGTQLAPNLTDSEWLNIEMAGTPEAMMANIEQVVRNGVPTPKTHPAAMPPMGGAQLSDEQVRAVAAYVYSLSHGG